MLSFRETPVTDATAIALLTDYFDFRAATFPAAARYRTVFPEPGHFTAPHGSFVVADNDAQAVGCGGIRAIGPARFELKHLWIEPTARGRGYGRALLAHLESLARQLGATELVLDTHASLQEAGALYRSGGYQDIDAYNENPNATNWYGKTL